jgi:predicted secreted protein
MTQGSGGTGLVLTFDNKTVGEVQNAPMSFPEGGRINMSSHDTTGTEDTKSGLAGAGTLRVTMIEVGGDEGQAAIRAALGNNQEYAFDIVYQNGDGASGMASVAGYEDATPFDGPQTATAILRITAKPTWTPAGSGS